MGTINRSWHEANRMPPKATAAQRIAWHLAHQQHCSCRPVPAGVQKLIAARAQEGKT
ncbi:MAG: hypothetical protein QM776_18210 [Rhodocyclaceae bacterium]